MDQLNGGDLVALVGRRSYPRSDRGKLGWKWFVTSERHGVPVGWAVDGAHRHDVTLLEPTLAAVASTGLLEDITTLHLDRGYDSGAVRDRLRDHRIEQFEIQRRGTEVPGVKKQPLRLGLRWIVEATNTWWSDCGQLRRNTDRPRPPRRTSSAAAWVIWRHAHPVVLVVVLGPLLAVSPGRRG